jgi:dienelactone hydrolase
MDPRDAYSYDQQAPLEFEETAVHKRDGITVHAISYASPKGGRVTAYLVVPRGNGPFAGLLFLHPAGGDRSAFLDEAVALAPVGVVSLLIDAPSARPEPWRRLARSVAGQRAIDVQAIVDVRRGVDLLVARPDVDARRLGYVGYSFGGGLGGVLAGIERRIRAYVLMAGEPRFSEQLRASQHPIIVQFRESMTAEELEQYIAEMALFDPIACIGQAAPAAVFFQFGRRDEVIAVAAAEEYYRAASEPKAVRWYDAGHKLNEEAARDRAEWLRAQLGRDALDVSEGRVRQNPTA